VERAFGIMHAPFLIAEVRSALPHVTRN
jgi:hypothetical protein